MNRDGVYILELDQPLGNDKHQARYYCGWTRDLDGRLWHHQHGSGSAFTRAAVERGIGMQLALFIPGAGRDVERAIKNSKNIKRWMAGYLSRQKAVQ